MGERPTLWQRMASQPEAFASRLLDVAFWLKFCAYRDLELREQLRDAWRWVLKVGEPTPSLALRSNGYASRFVVAGIYPPGLLERAATLVGTAPVSEPEGL